MPSRLIAHTGGMAAPMDVTEGDGGGKGGKAALSVNRSSVKINKSNMRRAMTQPRPAPQVYKTEPAEFRSLVQRLTGTESSSPSNSSPSSASPSASKSLNPRLQKIAPPPLRPVFSYPTLQQALPPQQQPGQFTPGRSFLSSLAALTTPTPRHSNFPVSPLSFSPLPALSPGDQIWANVLNPGTSTLPPPPGTNAATSPMDFTRFAAPAPFTLPSPDQYGLLGNLYGYSPAPSSLSMDDTFSFPDNIPRSRLS